MNPAVVAFEAVRFRRGGRLVLDLPALRIGEGEVVGVVGANGAGKSSLLRLAALVERPDEGTVSLFGQVPSPATLLGLRRRTVLVMQKALLLDRSVLSNVALPLRWRGGSRAEAEAIAGQWLDRLGVGGLARRRATDLSGGEGQRVSLARALATGPRLLLLDEPFAALDQPSRQALVADLAPILREDGRATLLVTHDRDEVLRLAGRVAVLDGGRLVQDGPLGSVFARPATPAAAALLGADAVLEGRVEAVDGELIRVEAGPWSLLVVATLSPGTACRLCIHPGDVTLAAPGQGADGLSSRNRLRARVAAVESRAGGLVEVALEPALRALVTLHAVSDLGLEPGRDVDVLIKASAIHCFPVNEAAAPQGSR